MGFCSSFVFPFTGIESSDKIRFKDFVSAQRLLLFPSIHIDSPIESIISIFILIIIIIEMNLFADYFQFIDYRDNFFHLF